MRQFTALLFGILVTPLLACAQSLEWMAEHPGRTSGAVDQASISVSTVQQGVSQANDGLETKVRQYFSDAPLMAEISRCESRFRQFTDSGSVLDGGAGGMIGLFQINSGVHAAYARSIGMDINTVEGNLAYARKLYVEEGTDPWLSSFSCWHDAASSNAVTNKLNQDLILGSIGPEVRAVQVLLNAKGYKLADSGPGSPGQETEKFGSLTRAALRKFQCAAMQICSGSEHSTEYGMVGHKTRAVLLGESPTVALISQTEADQIAALQKQVAELSAQLFLLQQKIAIR